MAAQDISLFPRYSAAENRATNYTLLVLRLLYEQSPVLYEEALERLLPDIELTPQPAFRQQEAVSDSVPDGVIAQKSYLVYVETKLRDAFDKGQIRRHLADLARKVADSRVLIALSTFANEDQQNLQITFEELASSIADKHGVERGRLAVAVLSFADFVDALPPVGAETFLHRVIEEYRGYLDGEGLLDTWRTRLTLVPVGKWPEHFTDLAFYSCPTQGTGYQHQRARFLGAYEGGRVTHVAEIRAVVHLPVRGKPSVRWRNDEMADEAWLLTEARRRAVAAWGKDHIAEDLNVFILGEPNATDFRKDTRGGLRSRRYIDLSSLTPTPNSAATLATRLNGKRWSDIA